MTITASIFGTRRWAGYSCRAALLATAGFVATGPAFAQQAATPAPIASQAAADPASEISEIVITSSRIARDGFTSPTPTTVVSQEFIQDRALTNIGEALNKVPSFRAAVSPSAGGLGNSGAFLADLRGLGPTRTLVLLDRARLPQTIVPGLTTSAGRPISTSSRPC